MWKQISAVILFLPILLGTAKATDISVAVHVRTAAGQPIAKAYVALVPAWRPSNRPLVEEIADADVAVLTVPAGTYWLITGAKGFAVISKGPISVSPGSDIVVMALPALKTARGTVRDEDGR